MEEQEILSKSICILLDYAKENNYTINKNQSMKVMRAVSSVISDIKNSKLAESLTM